MSTTPTPPQLADAAWKQVFVEGPYTAVIMLDYLRDQAGVTKWSDVLRAGFKGRQGLQALEPANGKKEAIMKDPNLKVIWEGTTGRCTSFAVKVIDRLEKTAPKDTFKFNIYDIGKHRVARCEKTKVLIDSSARMGAFQLPEGDWVRMEGSEASWKWVSGKSKFEKREGVSGIKESEKIISKEEALVKCLFELPGATSIPTLFRSIDKDTKLSVFHAMIKWSWKDKALEIVPQLHIKKKTVIKFGGGTDATHTECVETLTETIADYGGPHGKEQWAAVQDINSRIWDAAVEVWGKPMWKDVEGY